MNIVTTVTRLLRVKTTHAFALSQTIGNKDLNLINKEREDDCVFCNYKTIQLFPCGMRQCVELKNAYRFYTMSNE